MATSAGPTLREIILVALLLGILLFFDTSRHISDPPEPYFGHPSVADNASLTTSLQPDKPQPLRTRLTFSKSKSFDTKIIAHVPGTTVRLSLPRALDRLPCRMDNFR